MTAARRMSDGSDEGERDGKRLILCRPVIGVAGEVFQAVGVARPA
jgi:hypothetical protein